jgi:hypothetical protein
MRGTRDGRAARPDAPLAHCFGIRINAVRQRSDDHPRDASSTRIAAAFAPQF